MLNSRHLRLRAVLTYIDSHRERISQIFYLSYFLRSSDSRLDESGVLSPSGDARSSPFTFISLSRTCLDSPGCRETYTKAIERKFILYLITPRGARLKLDEKKRRSISRAVNQRRSCFRIRATRGARRATTSQAETNARKTTSETRKLYFSVSLLQTAHLSAHQNRLQPLRSYQPKCMERWWCNTSGCCRCIPKTLSLDRYKVRRGEGWRRRREDDGWTDDEEAGERVGGERSEGLADR